MHVMHALLVSVFDGYLPPGDTTKFWLQVHPTLLGMACAVLVSGISIWCSDWKYTQECEAGARNLTPAYVFY